MVDKAFGICRGVVFGVTFIRQQRRVVPDGLPISAPVDAESPARQLLAGVPLALPNMHKTTHRIVVLQFLHDVGGKTALGRALGFGVPFRCIAVRYSDKSRLATHGQAHVVGLQVGIHRFTQGQNVGPLLFAVGLGDTGRL